MPCNPGRKSWILATAGFDTFLLTTAEYFQATPIVGTCTGCRGLGRLLVYHMLR